MCAECTFTLCVHVQVWGAWKFCTYMDPIHVLFRNCAPLCTCTQGRHEKLAVVLSCAKDDNRDTYKASSKWIYRVIAT